MQTYAHSHAGMHTRVYAYTYTYMHTFSHTPISTFINWVSKLLFPVSILGKKLGTSVLLNPVLIVYWRPQEIRKLSSHVALSWPLIHRVTHHEFCPHLWASQPSLAGGNEGIVLLHFYTMPEHQRRAQETWLSGLTFQQATVQGMARNKPVLL